MIWISDEPDRVFTDEQGFIPVFSSELALASYAKIKKLTIINEEPILHNLDLLEQWLQQPEEPIDCYVCLSAWNLFSDVAYSLQLAFNGDKKDILRNHIYDKLFYGNNLYPMTANGGYYIPQWSEAERKKLVQILNEGISLFKSRLIETKI